MDKLGRPGVDGENIIALVVFEPEGGVLKADRKKNDFSLTINCAGIPSGIYIGDLNVLKADGTEAVPTIKVALNL